MDDLQTEKEQLEEMRAWWSEYGKVVIAGIVIAIAGLVGFNQYTAEQLASQNEASDLFEELVGHVVSGDLDSAESTTDDLANNYANTAYAAQAKLAMARLFMDQNRDQDAADILQELLASDSDEGLQNIGRLRLANVLLYQDKPQEAVDLLENADATAFSALYDEALGDAYAALGEYDKAREAYSRALADPSPNPIIDVTYVQMKLVDLPEVTVAEAASEEVAEDAPEEPAIEGGDSE